MVSGDGWSPLSVCRPLVPYMGTRVVPRQPHERACVGGGGAGARGTQGLPGGDGWGIRAWGGLEGIEQDWREGYIGRLGAPEHGWRMDIMWGSGHKSRRKSYREFPAEMGYMRARSAIHVGMDGD